MGLHYEHLTAEERATIMVMKRDDCSARHIARILNRFPSTISRELKRFDGWPVRSILDDDNLRPYDARAAAIRARRNQFKPRRVSKLVTHAIYVWCRSSVSF